MTIRERLEEGLFTICVFAIVATELLRAVANVVAERREERLHG